MKTDIREDYQRLIDIGESMLKSTAEHWHEIPAERLPVARFGQGLDGLFVAAGHLMLGQIDQARDWFAISGQFFFEASRPSDSVISEKRALECALFSGDREFRLRVARQIMPRESQIKPMEHSYTMLLKHLILNQKREAAAFMHETVWLSPATMQARGGYGTLQDACRALADDEPGEFKAALESLLQEHGRRASQSDSRLPEEMICFPATALLILAREQGLNVDVTSPFIPPALLE